MFSLQVYGSKRGGIMLFMVIIYIWIYVIER